MRERRHYRRREVKRNWEVHRICDIIGADER
jgi:hypothetical protein